MKTTLTSVSLICVLLIGGSCAKTSEEVSKTSLSELPAAGQSAVHDDESKKNIVQTAMASPDHTTLVAALKAAEYVDALSNAGPFTVFAPTDQAFDELPEGTVDDLTKPENKARLQDVLEYHVYVGVIRESFVQTSMNLNQVNGKNVTLTKNGTTMKANEANIIGAVETSNGIIYVIDKVLIPGTKQTE